MFLSVVTRTYRRPKMFKALRESLVRQTDIDFEHVILHDYVGVGVPKANAKLREVEVHGEYVAVLDDDVRVIDDKFVEKLKGYSGADVLVVEMTRGGRVLPARWPPERTHIDGANFVVTKAVWDAHKRDWGESYEGDWDFISSVMEARPNVTRISGVMIDTQRISKGAPE